MYHPNINTDAAAEARFKEVNEAYDVLKDPDERAAYDQLGQEPPSSGRYEPLPGWDNEFSFSPGEPDDTEGLSDFFETLFRRGTGPASSMAAVPAWEDVMPTRT